MLFAFDLWRREDVAANASMILERLQAGDMPCDRSWPNEHVALFRDLMKMGHRPQPAAQNQDTNARRRALGGYEAVRRRDKRP
jgi:hypothetical protein